MNTKIGIIGIALAVLIMAALTAPASAYVGDHPFTVYRHGQINGDVIYLTNESGLLYTKLGTYNAPELSQDFTVDIPAGADVKLARLYNYNTWSRIPSYKGLQPGVPAEAKLTLTDTTTGETLTRTCMNPEPECTDLTTCDSGICNCSNPIQYGNGVVQYWDIKEDYSYIDPYIEPDLLGYGPRWRYPGGTFAWDVTNMVTGSGTYTAKIENAKETIEGEYFCTYGFGLLVVYSFPGARNCTYWIAEGNDLLYNKAGYAITQDMATTSALFEGYNPSAPGMSPVNATLTIVSTAVNQVDTKNMVFFNSQPVGPQIPLLIHPLGKQHIGLTDFNVTALLAPSHNKCEIQDRTDYFETRNAFLVVKH